MEIKNIIKSTKIFEFVNQIDDLILEILYDSNNGYVNFTSKKAIDEAECKIKYFDDNAAKLIEQSMLSEVNDIVEEKRENLIFAIRKHLEEQVFFWCDEVYRNCIENCITLIAINRNDKSTADKIFQKATVLTNWISDVKNLSEKEKVTLLEEFYNELEKTVKSNNFKLEKVRTESEEKIFLDLFFKINEKDFLRIDLTKYAEFLSKSDLNYFQQIQINLSTFKSDSIKDENNLVQSAIQILNLKDNKEKYDFIKSIINDFMFFKFENKKITNQDKINLIKERIALFKDKSNYFKNKIKN